MQRYSLSFVVLSFVLMYSSCYAQDDLMSQLESSGKKAPVMATFKSPRIINGHSVETRKAGSLDFVISHRFGRLNSGIENLFGLDEAHIRFGLDYAVSDRFTVGVGRSSFKKIYDGFLKYRLLLQKQDGTPVSVTAFAGGSIDTQDPPAGLEYEFRHKVAYVSELLIARKFSPSLSLQLMPVWVHRNLVANTADANDVYALGIAGRQKLTNRTALTFEYYYRFSDELPEDTYNSLGIGVDIETGGHVFQLHLTNSRSMVEKEFISGTTGDFFNGDIHLGFNIIRIFQLKKPKLPEVNN